MLSELMRRQDGHVCSVEHAIAWSARLRRWCRNWQLEDSVSVITAPLGPATLALEQNEWFNTDILRGEDDMSRGGEREKMYTSTGRSQ